jgi:hypothetical protein
MLAMSQFVYITFSALSAVGSLRKAAFARNQEDCACMRCCSDIKVHVLNLRLCHRCQATKATKTNASCFEDVQGRHS